MSERRDRVREHTAADVNARLDDEMRDRLFRDSKVLYLFVDGIAERLHLGQPREAVLAAWAITESGAKMLLGLAPGMKEDTARCRDFLRDLKARNLSDPVLVATDGAPGLIRAVEEVFPRSLRQRCLAHKMRNLEAKVPGEVWREVKGAAYAAYQAGRPKLAVMAKDDFIMQYERNYPSATACFLDDFEVCVSYLQLPMAHRRATVQSTRLAVQRAVRRSRRMSEPTERGSASQHKAWCRLRAFEPGRRQPLRRKI